MTDVEEVEAVGREADSLKDLDVYVIKVPTAGDAALQSVRDALKSGA